MYSWKFGGKAANLGEAMQHMEEIGYKIPDGFVIPEEDLDAFHNSNCLQFTDVRHYMVRSSFVGEDSVRQAHAGRFKSVQVEIPEGVSPYGFIRNAANEIFDVVYDGRKCVIVQPYIKGQLSGEYFTYNPDNGKHPTCWSVRSGNGGTVDGTTNGHGQTPPPFQAIGEELVLKFGRHLDLEWVVDDDKQIWLVQVRPITAVATRKEKILVGVGILNDYAKGRCRVVLDPDNHDIPDDEKDFILVAPHTNRRWEDLMLRAAGLITDHGTNTCHAAVFAREIHLPAAVGTLEATKKLHDGQWAWLNTLDEPGFGIVYKEVLYG